MQDAPRLRLGTRASPLARWQADWVTARLAELGVQVEQVLITTQGDVRTGPLGAIGGQGLFTKEIQRALLEGRIDLAVHSLKDLPTEPVAGLTLTAVPERESPGDALVAPAGATWSSWEELPPGAKVGTGSTRRRAQLLHLRPDLKLDDVRGNVDTRLRKLDEGGYDALVLAEAGLKRLGLQARITQVLPADRVVSAVGQGALGLETRTDDATARSLLQPLDHAATHAAVLAERALLAHLRGGCLAPVGARAAMNGEVLELRAVVLSVDGRERLEAAASGAPQGACQVGVVAAEALLAQGAQRLIGEARGGL